MANKEPTENLTGQHQPDSMGQQLPQTLAAEGDVRQHGPRQEKGGEHSNSHQQVIQGQTDRIYELLRIIKHHLAMLEKEKTRLKMHQEYNRKQPTLEY